MTERSGAVTFKGAPLTLVGTEVAAGVDAPDFTLIGPDLSPLSLSDFSGKTVVIVAVPSLDTSVCDIEARRFNEAARTLGDDVVVLTVSMDLPFAQDRWCGASGADAIKVGSDHRDAEFAASYGLLIKELRLIARTVLVVDKEGKIVYQQIVKEMTDEPDYDKALEAVRNLKS
jgi:thioredoxin-dependent peroxiredoxin